MLLIILLELLNYCYLCINSVHQMGPFLFSSFIWLVPTVMRIIITKAIIINIAIIKIIMDNAKMVNYTSRYYQMNCQL